MHKTIAIASLFVILALVNWSILGKERHLNKGETVYLELAPVDPRSLMQGDYMALRFRMAEEIYQALPKTEESKRLRHDVTASDGFVVAQLDNQSRATFKSLYENQHVANNEILLQYRIRNSTVKFATNAFFFQEGHAKFYEPARYGQFRVNEKGEVLLAAMYDKDLKKLGP